MEMSNDMQTIHYGRRRLAFSNGRAVPTSTTHTVRAHEGEDEAAFVQRLLAEWDADRGTIEIVFKGGSPDYAVVTIEQSALPGEAEG
ncbi:MAG: hypothetical protein GX579_22225 [Chloroflexi bacterium]|jgi:hypothetical protein|nr:hypothetical protein [Chloroflexota bacterium]